MPNMPSFKKRSSTKKHQRGGSNSRKRPPVHRARKLRGAQATQHFDKWPLAHRDVQLRYVFELNLQATLGLIAFKTMRLNGCRIPAITSGGSPQGWDPLTAQFQNYRCYSASWNYKFRSVNPCIIGFVLHSRAQTDISIMTSIEQIIQQKRSKWMAANTAQNHRLSGSTGMASLVGVRRARVQLADTFNSNVSGEPAEQTYITFFMEPKPAVDPADVFGVIEMKFYIRFSEPIPQPLS